MTTLGIVIGTAIVAIVLAMVIHAGFTQYDPEDEDVRFD